MKKVILFLLIPVYMFSCSDKIKTIDFTTLNETEFNRKPFQLPNGRIVDSLKQAHDSCMGFSFNANAMLIQTKDTFFIGSIVKKQSMKIVNTLSDLGLTQDQLITKFNFISTPCYEKRVLHFPLKSILGENFILQLPGANEALDKEINDAVSASGDIEMDAGSWLYLDMKDALKKILDTTKSAAGLRYKENLLDSNNIVLMALEGITDIGFIINTKKDISPSLQTVLKSKPLAVQANPRLTIQLFYISNNKFQLSIKGIFPVVGEFMNAKLI